MQVHKLCQHFTALWWASDTRSPLLGSAYTRQQQSIAERHLERFLEVLTSELEHAPRMPIQRQAAQTRLFSVLGPVAHSALDLDERQLKMTHPDAFAEAAVDFAQQARCFDPTLSNEDIFQASRNLWVLNCLQFLLGLRVEVTPAAFAYSLLYPYSDNYLDDPQIPRDAKVAFNDRFRCRLAGERETPANDHERIIFDLVRMIERQYRRVDYPEVFESLLAIHAAQARSLHLHRQAGRSEDVDVVGISVEKGGTSVLADGFLAAGTLTPAQQEFIFGYGVFAQLVDDLEDVRQDGREGRLTVFSQAAHGPLDAVTNRTFHFRAKVLEGLNCFDSPTIQPLADVIRRGAVLLLLMLAGQARELYTRPYLQDLETHSPFRFAFLRQCRRRLSGRLISPQRLIEAWTLAV